MNWFSRKKTKVDSVFKENPPINKVINDALLAAAARGSLANLRLAIMDGAEINVCNDEKMTALHLAAKNDHIDCVNYLLESGVNFSLLDSDKKTALYYACEKGCEQIVKSLVDKGADVYYQCNGESALGVAAKNGRLECVQYLIEQVIDFSSRRNEIHAAYALAYQAHEQRRASSVLAIALTKEIPGQVKVMSYIEVFVKTLEENLALNNEIDDNGIDQPVLLNF